MLLLFQTYFYRGVVEEFGVNVGRLTYALLTLSAGMFSASIAFLPSTTSMYLTCLAYGAWFNRSYKLAIFASALSALLSKYFVIAILLYPSNVFSVVEWAMIFYFLLLYLQRLYYNGNYSIFVRILIFVHFFENNISMRLGTVSFKLAVSKLFNH